MSSTPLTKIPIPLSLPLLKQLHAHLLVSATLFRLPSASLLLSSYATRHLPSALALFARLPYPSTFLFNSLIKSLSDASRPRSALSLFPLLLSHSLLPNNYTFSFLLKAASDLPDPTYGQVLHAQIVRLGWEGYDFVQNGLIHMYVSCGLLGCARKLFDGSSSRDVVSWTAMVNGYAKAGEIEVARELFEGMPERNAVSWGAMIAGCTQFGRFEEALGFFIDMQVAGIVPNHACVVGALTACAFLGALEQGRWIHAFVERKGMELDRILGTALIDMYAKCGCIETANQVFSEMAERDVFAYTSMISGLSNHGHSGKALELFNRMQHENVRPNEVTFICALSACGRIGMVKEGKIIFKSMKQVYGMEPGVEHYGCLVDLLGQAGLLEEACKVVYEMPMKPDSYVLGALLSACRVHGSIELVEAVAKRLEELGYAHGGTHVLLSNMYASRNRWEEVAMVRKGMEAKKVRKVPGCSMVEVDGVSYEFVAGGNSHLLMERVVLAVEQMDGHLKLFGLDNVEDSVDFKVEMVT